MNLNDKYGTLGTFISLDKSYSRMFVVINYDVMLNLLSGEYVDVYPRTVLFLLGIAEYDNDGKALFSPIFLSAGKRLLAHGIHTSTGEAMFYAEVNLTGEFDPRNI